MKNYLTKLTKNTWVQIILTFVIIAAVASTCTSCAYQESLFECDDSDRIIVGYTKNMKKYKVVSGCGNWAQPVRICDSIIGKPGDALICEY